MVFVNFDNGEFEGLGLNWLIAWGSDYGNSKIIKLGKIMGPGEHIPARPDMFWTGIFGSVFGSLVIRIFLFSLKKTIWVVGLYLVTLKLSLFVKPSQSHSRHSLSLNLTQDTLSKSQSHSRHSHNLPNGKFFKIFLF